MTGIDDDLATLRDSNATDWDKEAASSRVEAEIALLREENETLRDKLVSWEEVEDEGDGRDPDGYRYEGGRMIPTDR